MRWKAILPNKSPLFSQWSHYFSLLLSKDKHFHSAWDCIVFFPHKKVVKKAFGQIFSIFFFMFFFGGGTYKIKVLWGKVTLFCRAVRFLFMDLPGTQEPGSSPPALWFSLPSFETRPGPPAVHWTPHQTARKETREFIRAQIKIDVNTGGVGERHIVSREEPKGPSTDTKTRRLTLCGRFYS